MNKQIESLLTIIENGLSEHIHLLKMVNEKSNQETQEGFYDYQTAAESNEALNALRSILSKEEARDEINTPIEDFIIIDEVKTFQYKIAQTPFGGSYSIERGNLLSVSKTSNSVEEVIEKCKTEGYSIYKKI